METTADALDVGILYFLERSDDRHRRVHRDPQSAARASVRSRRIITPDDLAQVPIGDKKKSDGTPLRPERRGQRGRGHLAAASATRSSTTVPASCSSSRSIPWANTLEVTHGVEEALAELRPGLPGLEMDSTIFRPADFIQVALDNLTRALLLGCLLVMLVLAAFLFEWRTALISLVAIPLSLVAGGLVLYLTRRDHQHDDPGGVRDRHRRRRRRCDHRRRKHRAAAAPVPQGGQHQVDGAASFSRPRSKCARPSSTRR